MSGARIGEALAEIDTHCADSGQSPKDAFGDPVSYAATLAREPQPAAIRAPHRPSWLGGMLALLTWSGVLCLFLGFDALRSGLFNGTLHVAHLVAVGVATAAVVVAGRMRRTRPGSSWPLVTGTALGAGMLAYSETMRAPSLFIESGWGLLAVGTFLLALAWWPNTLDRYAAGRIIDPRTGTPSRTSRLRAVAIRWSLPAVLCLVAVVVVLVPRESFPYQH